ncbi:MAG TPA: alpha/beta hydrolase [Candidatus Hydrogenedentes bacterium]|nr:alpha/beta hydrolase [Candidatus Hydrogenedentota bacterium]
MRFSGKKKWIAGCGVLVLAPVVFMSLWVWSITPERVEGACFDSAGVRIHYTDEGQGTPVLLVHGLAVNADVQWRWRGLMQLLTKDYRVIALDTRGHGLSDKPHDPAMYGIQMVEDIVRLLDHLHIEKAHVVGYSFGGFITLKLVATHPERLLSAAVCGAGWEQPTEENLVFGEAVAQAMEKGKGFGPLNKRLGLGDGPPPLYEKLVMKLALYYFNDRRALAATMRGGLELAVSEEELRANRVPVLVMVGSKDGLRPDSEELAKRMANCALVIVEGGGHINTSGKTAFHTGLLSFLARQAASPDKKEPSGEVADLAKVCTAPL